MDLNSSCRSCFAVLKSDYLLSYTVSFLLPVILFFSFPAMAEQDVLKRLDDLEKECRSLGFKGKQLNTFEGTGLCVSILQGILEPRVRKSRINRAKIKCNQSHPKSIGTESYGNCVLNGIELLRITDPPDGSQNHDLAETFRKECLKLGHQEGTKELNVCINLYPFATMEESPMKRRALSELTPENIKKALQETR